MTTAELLKNHFFSRDQKKEYEAYWRPVFEEEEKDYWDREITVGRRLKKTLIDSFFYSYLQIKIQDKDFKSNSKR